MANESFCGGGRNEEMCLISGKVSIFRQRFDRYFPSLRLQSLVGTVGLGILITSCGGGSGGDDTSPRERQEQGPSELSVPTQPDSVNTPAPDQNADVGSMAPAAARPEAVEQEQALPIELPGPEEAPPQVDRSDVPTSNIPASNIPTSSENPVGEVPQVEAPSVPETNVPETNNDPVESEPTASDVFGLIDRTGWVLSASNNEADISNAVDGLRNTRWTTREVQQPGQWLIIDLARTQRFNRIELDTGLSPLDFPRRYQVFVSTDGEAWGSPIAAGEGAASTVIEFSSVEARYVRVDQVSSAVDRFWWSIHEITLELVDADDAPPVVDIVPEVPVALEPPVTAEPPVAPVNSDAPNPSAPGSDIPASDPDPVVVENPPSNVEPEPPVVQASLEEGYELYGVACAFCHGVIADSSKRGAVDVSIQYALEHEEEMKALRLTETQVASIALALADDVGICRPESDPGPVVMRRLSNDEYVNTVRDLLGVELDGNDLPGDSIAGNFTNIGSSNVNSEHALGYSSLVPDLSQAINDRDNVVTEKYRVCDISNTGVNCASRILEQFLVRAFRRDLEAGELSRYTGIYSTARGLDQTRRNSLALAVEAALLSPHFVFLVETDSNPGSSDARPLNDFELASRLSYFLWGSMPDDALLNVAREGRLGDELMMVEQVDRMLSDEKSTALVDTFFEQWMSLRDFADPESNEFSYIPAQLRTDMLEETKQIFRRQFVEGGSDMRGLLTTKTTYLNGRMADYYGVGGDISGNQFQESAMGAGRAGLLGQASILASTSKEFATQPVARGKWVLDEILCESPRTPPPDVGELPAAEETNLSLRETLEEHRRNPACAACHESMDPIGLGLESFDQNGHFRDIYASGETVDNFGELPDGQTFNGLLDLSEVLEEDPRYLQCVTEKFVSYARGALVGPRDNCRIERITEQASTRDFSVRELVMAIISDTSFSTRRSADQE